MIKSPPLHLIYAFESVARNRSFTLAAEELNVTRSTISHRVKTLEEFLDSRLFDRTTRSIHLSSSGAAYYLMVKDALESLDALSKVSTHQCNKEIIKISSPPTFANICLLPSLNAFIQQQPNIEVVIEIVKSQLDFESSQVDFDIRYGSGVYPGMICRQITHDSIFAVASPFYAKKMQIAEPQHLKHCALLRSYLEPWTPWFKQAGLSWGEPKKGHRFEDLSLLYQAAQNHWGIALARESLVKERILNGALISLFEIKALSNFQYYVIYDSRKRLSDDAMLFIDWLCSEKEF